MPGTALQVGSSDTLRQAPVTPTLSRTTRKADTICGVFLAATGCESRWYTTRQRELRPAGPGGSGSSPGLFRARVISFPGTTPRTSTLTPS